uniref:Thyroglobulin type-1 domain-containing protein n=1 Tax=Phlebotomus papatasi TaxID=29031 RepID=A0A1B0DFV3_PHLPP
RFKEQTGCPVISLPCRIQNSTHNGRIFPSPVPCNCCETCIENFELEDDCTVGSPGSPIPHGRCGDGLTCASQEDDEHTICQLMSGTNCLKDQESYDTDKDKGTTGHLAQRTLCDADGDYSPIKCIPGQICYCVDTEGRRIFGEALNIRGIEILMKCECSRQESSLGRVLETDMRVPFVRCNEMGSFDQLQCIKDQCLCVDIHSGFPTSDVVNITSQGLQTLPCFNESGYNNDSYHRECEEKKSILVQTLYNRARIGLYASNDTETYEFCQPDGYYARIQQNDTHKFCSDKFGNRIANYAAILGSPEADTMTCNCARVELLLKEKEAYEIPVCCSNGNYPKVSCRRGLCFCTDENGNQTSMEVPHEEIKTLDCYSGKNFC